MRAVVFDFDGVLVDSEPMHERALRAALGPLGMAFTTQAYYTRYVGLDDRDCFAAIFRDHARVPTAQELVELGARKRAGIERAMANGEPHAYPGAVELVRACARLSPRVPMAVCSGSLPHEIEPVLERLGVRSCFAEIVTAADVARAKPDPAGYLLTAKRLGVEAVHCTTIEDTPRGIEAAKGAGYRCLAVCHTRPRAELSGGDSVFDRIGDISARELMRGA